MSNHQQPHGGQLLLPRQAQFSLPFHVPGDQRAPLREAILTCAGERGVEVVFIREDTCIDLSEEDKLTIFAPMAQAGTAGGRPGCPRRSPPG